jgi:hypothetical protein
MPSFEEVVEVVREERSYQNGLSRNAVKVQKPLEQIAIIETIISRLKSDWYDRPGEVDLHYVRKIAATAFRILEEHDAPRRRSVPTMIADPIRAYREFPPKECGACGLAFENGGLAGTCQCQTPGYW